LSDNASDDEVKKLFSQCGHVKTFRRIHDKKSKDFTGAGFVEFTDRFAARQALRMNGYKFFLRKLRVEMAKQKTMR
jgi:RNA recognition motif-containing protein